MISPSKHVVLKFSVATENTCEMMLIERVQLLKCFSMRFNKASLIPTLPMSVGSSCSPLGWLDEDSAIGGGNKLDYSVIHQWKVLTTVDSLSLPPLSSSPILLWES